MNRNTQIAILLSALGLTSLWWYSRGKKTTPEAVADAPPPEPEDHYIPTTPKKERSLPVTQPIHPKRKVEQPPIVHRRHQGIDIKGFYRHLQDAYETTQITLTNTSDVTREVRLWGGNKKPPISPALPGDIQDHVVRTLTPQSSQGAASYPQGMIVNPYNGFTYIANQLSNTITILNQNNQVIKIIPIVADGSPFGAAPVDLTVFSLASSPNVGRVYVVNSVWDSISVIDTNLEIIQTIPVGLRPVSITFNPVNGYLYTTNIADNTVSIVDPETATLIDTIPVGNAPKNSTVHADTGDVYVLNTKDDSITIIDQSGQVTNTLQNIGQGLVNLTIVEATNSLYVVSETNNAIIPVALETNALGNAIPVGNRPYPIIYNPNSELLYVGNRDDDTFSIIDQSNTVIDTIALGAVNTGVALNLQTDVIYTSDPLGGAISIITYSEESSAVLVNEGYAAKREDFIYRPVEIGHVKFVLSGEERFKVLQLQEQTITGKTIKKPISFSAHQSPQNFGNVSEIFGMHGMVIDGKNEWLFQIAGKQTITILTYYKQLETERFIDQSLTVS